MIKAIVTLSITVIAIFSLLGLSSLPAVAANALKTLQANTATEWDRQLDDKGIQIWIASAQDSNFKKFKGIVQIKAPIDEVVSLIQDTEQLPDWYYNTVTAKRLKTPEPNQLLKYTVTKTPWPVTNRDSVVMGTKTISENGTVTITLEGRPDEYPLQENLIRVQKLTGYWIITPITPSRTQVEFMLATEPGGEIPSWLANSMVIDMPFYTLRNLRKKLESN